MDADTTDWFPFKKDWLEEKGKLEDLLLIRVTGDSMEPTLSGRNLVLLNKDCSQALSDGIYALTYNKSLHVKRLQITPDKLIMQSANSHYKDICIDLVNERLPKSIKIVGRAVCWWHE